MRHAGPVTSVLLASIVLACSGETISPEAQVFAMRTVGDGQIGDAGVGLSPFRVEVFDEHFHPVHGATIVWDVVAGTGIVDPVLATTDQDGTASAVLTPGPGENLVQVSVRGTATQTTLSATGCDPACPEWSFEQPLPPARLWSNGVVAEGRIWLLGGRLPLDAGVTSNVVTYDPDSERSEPGATLPVPRSAGVVAAVGERIYYIGGIDDDFWVSRGQPNVFGLDPSTGEWTSGAPLATARFYAAGAAVGGKIYVAGGLTECDDFDDTCGPALSSLEIYDPAADRWTSGAPMNTARAGAGAAAIDGRLYVAGGQDCRTWWMACHGMSSVEMYDPATDAWTTKSPMPLAGRANLVVVGHKLIAFISSFQRSIICEYDPALDAWRPIANAPLRIGAVVAALDDRVYVIGGDDGNYQPHDTVMLLRP